MTDFELLEGLYVIEGWHTLTDHQRDVLFLVFQDHRKAYEGARLSNMIRVASDATNRDQVRVYYQDKQFYYDIDTNTGRSIWY
mgnify:CR=1 FL=1